MCVDANCQNPMEKYSPHSSTDAQKRLKVRWLPTINPALYSLRGNTIHDIKF
jgi:hypothetical protein